MERQGNPGIGSHVARLFPGCALLHPGYGDGDPTPVVSLLLVEGHFQEHQEMEQGFIRRIIELYGATGFVTFDQLNDLLPSATTASEDIEAIMTALSDAGINVVEKE